VHFTEFEEKKKKKEREKERKKKRMEGRDRLSELGRRKNESECSINCDIRFCRNHKFFVDRFSDYFVYRWTYFNLLYRFKELDNCIILDPAVTTMVSGEPVEEQRERANESMIADLKKVYDVIKFEDSKVDD
jgi:hypothetical protein